MTTMRKALAACLTVGLLVGPSVGSARSVPLADCGSPGMTAPRCPTTSEVGIDLPMVGQTSAATPDGSRVLVVGGDGRFGDRMAVAAFTAAGHPLYRKLVYLGGDVRVYASTVTPDGRTLIAAGRVSDGDRGDRTLTVAIDTATGALRWSRVGADNNTSDAVNAVVVDRAGRYAYTAAWLEEKAHSYIDDLLVEKLDLHASGKLVWRSQVGDQNGNDEYPLGISLGGGHVVVTGDVQKTTDAGQDYDFGAFFLNPATGRLQKQLLRDGGGNVDDYGQASARSADGRWVAITGYTTDDPTASTYAAVTAVVDTARMRWAWLTRTSGPATDTSAWAVSFAGPRVIVGASSGTAEAYSPAPYAGGYAGTGYRATAVSLDSRTGAEQWRTDVSDVGGLATFVAGVTTSPDGKTAYLSGYSGQLDANTYLYPPHVYAYPGAPNDEVVLALDTATGTLRWSSRWNAQPQGLSTNWFGVLTATRGGLFVSGMVAAQDPARADLDPPYRGAVLRFAP